MPRRLTLVINSLGSGGAERVLTTMANWWAEKGEKVTLITLAGTESDFYPLSPAVERMALNLSRPSVSAIDAVRGNLSRVAALRSALRESRPDAVLSFADVTNVTVLLASIGLGFPVIISERIDPRYYPLGRLWRSLRRLTYCRASLLVMQTEALRPWAETHIAPSRVRVIPNPVWIKAESAPGGSSPEAGNSRGADAIMAAPEKNIFAMGRLEPQKGFDVLIRAFAQVAPEFPEWSLTILGEGRLRAELEGLVQELGLHDRIRLPGRVPDPERVLRTGDLFVLSSRFEGFPNALVEAMACGLPIISTDCPTGPGEIVRDGVDGLLVPPEDVSSLADTMRRLMTNEAERNRLAARAGEVIERFSIQRVMSMWDDALNTVQE